jgi:hypothetical protein
LPRKPETDRSFLLQILDEGYNRRAWHGPTLKQSLRGVSAQVAAWRPGAARHNIWELTVHAAYWKYTVRRRLLGEKRGSFVLKGSNWFRRPVDLSEKAWRLDLAILDSEHRKLRATIRDYINLKRRHIPASTLFGIAFHDIYHAGQIRLLRQLQEDQIGSGSAEGA